MNYIKEYNSYWDEPKVGDYVLCKDYIISDIENKILSKIGIIISYDSEYKNYLIKYEPKKTPTESDKRKGINLYYMRRNVKLYSIEMWSKDKNEIESRLIVKKFNI